MKKILLVTFLMFAAIPFAHAQESVSSAQQAPQTKLAAADQTTSGFKPLAPINGLTDEKTANQSDGLASFFNQLYRYLIGLAAILAIIVIIRGGLEISTQDSISKQSDGKARIQQAILGLVLVLSPVIVFSIINPSILNLSISLEKVDLSSSSAPGGADPNPLSSTDQKSGCTVSGVYLQTAVCGPQGTVNAKDVADRWLRDNCFFLDAQASAVCTAGNPCTQATASCEGRSTDSYTLINIGTDSYPNLEPFDDQTSASLSQYKRACNADRGSVCANRLTNFISSSCPSYQSSVPSDASKKCFDTHFFCFNQKDSEAANSTFTDVTNASHNYICEPQLKFTFEPLK